MLNEDRYRTRIGSISLILGPALMSVGDLMHPAESWNPGAQVAILSHHGGWYAAHLLLFVGFLLLVPGILTLADLASVRRPKAGYAARVLTMVSVGALSAVFVFEMLLGRVISGGADQRTAVMVLETFQSGPVFFAILPGLLSFFIGIGLVVTALVSPAGPLRWPALVLGLGAALILAEIILAQVLLSQIGNILILVAGIGFARSLSKHPTAASLPVEAVKTR
jgi:hypothetical protein